MKITPWWRFSMSYAWCVTAKVYYMWPKKQFKFKNDTQDLKKKKNINTMNPFLKMKVMVSLFLFFFFWCCSNFICPPPQNCYHKSHCSLTAAPRRQLNTNVILKCGWTSTERMKKWYLKGNISCIGGSPAWRNLFFCCCPANVKAAALIERHGNSPVYFPRCF